MRFVVDVLYSRRLVLVPGGVGDIPHKHSYGCIVSLLFLVRFDEALGKLDRTRLGNC